jgi:hypothetical protein
MLFTIKLVSVLFVLFSTIRINKAYYEGRLVGWSDFDLFVAKTIEGRYTGSIREVASKCAVVHLWFLLPIALVAVYVANPATSMSIMGTALKFNDALLKSNKKLYEASLLPPVDNNAPKPTAKELILLAKRAAEWAMLKNMAKKAGIEI